VAEVAFVDASPLIFLGAAGRLELLRAAAARIVVSHAVAAEVAVYGPDDAACSAMRASEWIDHAADVEVPADLLAWDLGRGETQVLALARATPGSIAVTDDFEARRCARTIGVPVRGTLGLVLAARRDGRIAAARPLMELLRLAGMHLADDVLNRALRDVGE
jgi:predicted nucleic acid-binding protein